MNTSEIIEGSGKVIDHYRKYILPTYSPDLLLVRGSGSRVWDADDRRYLDFSTGISVCNLGHCHPAVTMAIQRQSGILVHVSNLYINPWQSRLAEKLVNQGFDSAVFFANSGAEANEGMIKFARKWGASHGKSEIIAMDNSFHGRTLATLAATGRSKYRVGFAPDMPGFKHVPFNDISALKQIISDKTAAIMLEPIQGEGGIIPADSSYLKEVRALCDQKNILLLFDEVQCGMGRTGSFFAFQNFDVEPDALSLAKALGNGFPIGAFLVKRDYAETLTAGTHASTFGGSALACAAGCAVIDVMEQERLLENCGKMAEYLTMRLRELATKYAIVKEIRGRGLMLGIQLDRNSAPLLAVCRKHGLLVLTAGEKVLRLMPPLNVSIDEVDEAINILDKSFAELTAIETEQ